MDNRSEHPQLSIIVPVYNVEEYIGECIESIISQSLTDWEMILVDDGSSDDSGKICDVYAGKDERIKVVHKKNGGLSTARNVGLDIARGQYITFIDSDDVIIGADVYERVLSEFSESQEIDVVQYDVIFKYLSSEEHTRKYPFKFYNGKEEILKGYLTEQIHVSFCDKVFRRKVIESVRFPEGQISEDIATIPDLVKNVDVLATTNIGYYGYRYREGSISHSKIPVDKILSVIMSYYTFLSYVMTFKNLRTMAIEQYSGIVWYYISMVRNGFPSELKSFSRMLPKIRIGFMEYCSICGKIKKKNRVRVFSVGVVGVWSSIILQKMFTRSA